MPRQTRIFLMEIKQSYILSDVLISAKECKWIYSDNHFRKCCLLKIMGFLSTKEHKNYTHVIIKRLKLKDRIVSVKWATKCETRGSPNRVFLLCDCTQARR